jgi:elongation factor G
MAHSSEDLRNLALIGHGHSGKTAVVDAIAFHTKAISRLGNSADGSSISNTEPEEKERKQTLVSHLFHFAHGKSRLNFIDTPGHGDFVAEALSALGVVEAACLCISATAPLTFHARQLWRRAGEAGAARAIVLTHLDHENISFEQIVDDLRRTLGTAVVPVTYPDVTGAALKTIHSVLANQGPNAARYHDWIEEDEAEVDDVLMEHYLEQGGLAAEEFERNLTRAMAAGKFVPLFAMVPNKQLGIEQFLEFVASHFPSPISFGARGAAAIGSEEYGQLVQPDPAGPFAAQVWKVVADPYVGRLAYLRCLRGGLRVEQLVVDARSGKTHKVAHILDVQGKDSKEVQQVSCGELFAISKIEDLGLGDTVTVDGAGLHCARPRYPAPTYSQHVWPKSRGDEQKIGQALEKLCAEDPTFQQHRDKDTGELIVAGMSPLHLEVQFHRMHRRYQVGVDHGPPTIPYRETITGRADGHHRHKKQTGGRGQFAEVYLRVAPRPSGDGFEFVDSVVGGSIPRQFIPEVEKGVRKFLVKGSLRLPGRRRQRRGLRRQVPRRRQRPAQLPARRRTGVPRWVRQGQADPARTDHGGRDPRARPVHRGRRRQPLQLSRPYVRDGVDRRHPAHQGARAVELDAGLFDAAAVDHRRGGHLHDGVLALRGGATEHPGRDRQAPQGA